LEESSYSSPEILANLSERKSFPLYNHYVSDTFSIGMIALYAMTLIDPVTAYKSNNKQIDYYYIEMLLRIAAQNGYSEYLLRCVAECVQLKNRPTVDEILSSYTELRCDNPPNSWLKLSLRKTGGEE
jgi:serine/threonine protein kinase